MTARDRPVIDAEAPRSWFALALRSSAQLPQRGVGAGAQAQGVSKPGCRLTTEGMAQRVQRPSLRLRTTLAAGVRTLEATHLNGKNDPPVEHRTFFQPAHIAAVASVTPAGHGAARTVLQASTVMASPRASLETTRLPTRASIRSPTKNLAHGNDQRKARSARNQAFDAAVTQTAGDPSQHMHLRDGRIQPARLPAGAHTSARRGIAGRFRKSAGNPGPWWSPGTCPFGGQTLRQLIAWARRFRQYRSEYFAL